MKTWRDAVLTLHHSDNYRERCLAAAIIEERLGRDDLTDWIAEGDWTGLETPEWIQAELADLER